MTDKPDLAFVYRILLQAGLKITAEGRIEANRFAVAAAHSTRRLSGRVRTPGGFRTVLRYLSRRSHWYPV